MKKITLLLVAIALNTAAAAQTKINLLICDTMGVSIERAIIRLHKSTGEKLPKELRRGIFSDKNGQALLDVVPGDRITISANGFMPEVITFVADHIKPSYAISLTPLTDAQISVGYGSQKTSLVTGSVSERSVKDIQGDQPIIDMLSFLQRAAPGVTVERSGSSYMFYVRGMGSINGGDQALVLVDGVQGDVGMLNPQDIDSVTVLKDASSTAIYGGRAAFGAVLIKTKRGHK